MPVTDIGASFGRNGAGGITDAVLVADGVSKRYPGRPKMMFPPVTSVFQRDLFKRKRSSEDPPLGSKRPSRDDDLDDEDDDDFEDEEERDEYLPPSRAAPGETFWALKDVSFGVQRGEAVGVLGGEGAGKSTLLRILAGMAFPTDGRVLVRDRVSPLPAALVRALKLADKGTAAFDLALGCRLLGIEPHLIKRHRAEILDLAQPLHDADGEPAPGWVTRLAVATTVVLPAGVILLEDAKGLDEAFMARVAERVRERLRGGSSLVFASRSPDLISALCDEVILLEEGLVVDRGAVQAAVARYEATQAAALAAAAPAAGNAPSPASFAPRGHIVWQGQKVRVPPVLTPFGAGVAILSARVRSPTGTRLKRLDASDELMVEVRLETAVPDTEIQCGVDFTPSDDEAAIRLELPEAVRCEEPGTYLIVARLRPGTLSSGLYGVRVDAIVSSSAERARSVIARDVGRIRIVHDELGGPPRSGKPVEHWDGRTLRHAEAEWSLEPSVARR